MQSHFFHFIALRHVCIIIVSQMLPTTAWAQYNSARKNADYLLPRVFASVAVHPTTERNTQIREGRHAQKYLRDLSNNEIQTGVSSMFRVNRKPSTTSIDRAIQYQRSLKQTLDLSFLATMGYSLFSHGQLYLPQNYVAQPSIK